MLESSRKKLKLYTKVLGLCFSPCGQYLASVDSSGNISVFSIKDVLGPEATYQDYKPVLQFKGHDSIIYSALSTERFLLTGGLAEIKAWDWNHIMKVIHQQSSGAKDLKPSWVIEIPDFGSALDKPEINAIQYSVDDNQMVAGGGDSVVYIWDLEGGQLKDKLVGHTDYIHCLTLKNKGQEILTGSEDGSVRWWDVRSSGEPVNIIEPYKCQEVSRPDVGNWISCVGLDDAEDWLVCGGGPSTSLWHLRSLSLSSPLQTPGVYATQGLFYQDIVITGGSEPCLNHWTLTGTHKAQIPCSQQTVYTVSHNQGAEDNQVLVCAGTSDKIDLFTNIGYKALSLEIY